jgi:hypothetical protein
LEAKKILLYYIVLFLSSTYSFPLFISFFSRHISCVDHTASFIFSSLLESHIQVKMKHLFRDTTLGHILRLATGGRVLRYEEDIDPSIWQKYVDKESSGRMAHHGTVEPADEKEDKEEENIPPHNPSPPRRSSDTRVDSQDVRHNEVSGVPVDVEKGKDVTMITWYSDDDPEVSFNILPTVLAGTNQLL